MITKSPFDWRGPSTLFPTATQRGMHMKGRASLEIKPIPRRDPPINTPSEKVRRSPI